MAAARCWCVYRLFADDGQLLWVGYSEDLHRRLQELRNEGLSWWAEVSRVAFDECDSREQARCGCWEAIQSEDPLHNQLRRKVGDAVGDGAVTCLWCGGVLAVVAGRGRRPQLCGEECQRRWEYRRRRLVRLAGVRQSAR
jgi:hypothetical protein